MKSEPSRTSQLLESLADMSVPADDPQRAARRRDQVVGHVASVVRDEQRRSRNRARPFVAALVAAAALLLVVGLIRGIHHHPAPERSHAAAVAPPAARARALEGTVLFARQGVLSPVTSEQDTTLESGDELRTAALGGATVALSSGVVVNVGPATTVSVGAVHAPPVGRDDIVLTMGRVDVSVPKLPAGSSFAVRTPDSEVVVHGTRFSVTVSAPSQGAPVATGVQVTEGRVAVLHGGAEASLTRGDTWSSAVAGIPAASSEEPVAAAASAAPTAEAASSARQPSSGHSGRTLPESSLAAENKLFQAAMEAKRRGDDRAVVATLDTLLSRYPSSPLAPNARVERFRALKRLGDDSAAAREARRYLAEDPDGFARDEARDTALTPAPSSSGPSR